MLRNLNHVGPWRFACSASPQNWFQIWCSPLPHAYCQRDSKRFESCWPVPLTQRSQQDSIKFASCWPLTFCLFCETPQNWFPILVLPSVARLLQTWFKSILESCWPIRLLQLSKHVSTECESCSSLTFCLFCEYLELLSNLVLPSATRLLPPCF